MFLLTFSLQFVKSSLQFVKSSQFHSVHQVANLQFRIFETSEIQKMCELSESMTVNGALFDEI